MKNELQPQLSTGLQKAPEGNAVNIQSVDTLVAHAETVQNNILIGGSALSALPGVENHGLPPAWDSSFYNLFVVPREHIAATGEFHIPKDQALQDTEENIFKLLSLLDPEAVGKIRSYPTIVALPNESYGVTAAEQLMWYGFLNGVDIRETSIRFGFTKLYDIPQRIFVEHAEDFSFGKAAAFNEFDRPHWAVKHINVVEALRNLGFQVLAFS